MADAYAVTPPRALALALTLLALLAAAPAAQAAPDRYALAGGCHAVAGPAGPVAGGPFRLQATALGRYLLWTPQGQVMTAGGDGAIVPAAEPGERGDFTVLVDGDGYTLKLGARPVEAAGQGLRLGAAATRLAFTPAEGCSAFPEAGVDVSGTPMRGLTPWGEVRGLADPHVHGMAFEFLGGRARCARPWHPYGVTKAMVDCPDHEPGGAGAALENFQSYGTPARQHDTTGWPTFKDWPAWDSLTHEQMYHKWLERSWRGGLRLMVNLLVDNNVLCEVYPYKKNSCNEMDGVRLQIVRIREFEDYVDAQSGGPGKGWFRIVTSPYEARRVINEGKLAVVLGIEVSRLFDCQVYNGVARCGREQIDRNLDFFHRAGVRQMELVNKFDNALSGVAGDAGTTGIVVNNGNKVETGRYWDMRACDGHAHDEPQMALPGEATGDVLAAGILGLFLGEGQAPVYPPPPHCNALGLSGLGEYTIRQMIRRGMIVDPDHMSVRARNAALAILEAERHPGVISSHSWSTPDAFPRIYRLGGMVTPMAKDTTSFLKKWRETKKGRDGRFYFGFGFGSDVNGFAKQGAPRRGAAEAGNAVTYPFRSSVDPGVTVDRNSAGQRTWDINVDGVAHYGLYPDWVEDLRRLGGEEVAEDMARGAEAYLQMWERSEGVPAERCRTARARFTARGLDRVRLGARHEGLLRVAGQPTVRHGRAWTWCVRERDGRRGLVRSVLSGRGVSSLVVSTYPEHTVHGARAGDRASTLRRRGLRRVAPGLYARRAGRATYVARVRKGRVRAVGVSTARTPKALRSLLREAGVR